MNSQNEHIINEVLKQEQEKNKINFHGKGLPMKSYKDDSAKKVLAITRRGVAQFEAENKFEDIKTSVDKFKVEKYFNNLSTSIANVINNYLQGIEQSDSGDVIQNYNKLSLFLRTVIDFKKLSQNDRNMIIAKFTELLPQINELMDVAVIEKYDDRKQIEMLRDNIQVRNYVPILYENYAEKIKSKKPEYITRKQLKKDIYYVLNNKNVSAFEKKDLEDLIASYEYTQETLIKSKNKQQKIYLQKELQSINDTIQTALSEIVDANKLPIFEEAGDAAMMIEEDAGLPSSGMFVEGETKREDEEIKGVDEDIVAIESLLSSIGTESIIEIKQKIDELNTIFNDAQVEETTIRENIKDRIVKINELAKELKKATAEDKSSIEEEKKLQEDEAQLLKDDLYSNSQRQVRVSDALTMARDVLKKREDETLNVSSELRKAKASFKKYNGEVNKLEAEKNKEVDRYTFNENELKKAIDGIKTLQDKRKSIKRDEQIQELEREKKDRISSLKILSQKINDVDIKIQNKQVLLNKYKAIVDELQRKLEMSGSGKKKRGRKPKMQGLGMMKQPTYQLPKAIKNAFLKQVVVRNPSENDESINLYPMHDLSKYDPIIKKRK
jgi:hypothetical protein